jgi:hypothetical protein
MRRMDRPPATCAVLMIFLAAVPSLAAETPAESAARASRELLDRNARAHPPDSILRARPSQRIKATLVYATGGPKLNVERWVLFAPLPPELPGQRGISYEAKPEVTKTAEPAGLRQSLLVWDIPGTDASRKVIGVNIAWSAELLSRSLSPLRAGETAPEVPPLPAEQRAAFTASNTLIDFHLPAFQEWLAQSQLRPAGEETDLDFARRLFLHLKEKTAFEFTEDVDRRASRVCKSMKSDCAGLTALYVAALRANGIPARQLVGRWALSAKKDEQLYGKPWQQEHVKTEFFAVGIGWVPVDISAAVDFDKIPGSLDRFGNDRGDFLAFHIDAELTLDVPKLGRRTVQFLQEPAVFCLGPGKFDGQIRRAEWVVEHGRAGR